MTHKSLRADARLISYTQPAPGYMREIISSPEHLIAYKARISNPKNQSKEEFKGLIEHLIKNKEWSPLDMVDVTIEVNTTRDVSHQIIRHWSFDFQEYSQRYAKVEQDAIICGARTQHPTNKQASIPVAEDSHIEDIRSSEASLVWNQAMYAYEKCLREGIAREVARKLLPEGLCPTTIMMKASVRNWYHYINLRTEDDVTQFDHVDVANECKSILENLLPNIFKEETE